MCAVATRKLLSLIVLTVFTIKIVSGFKPTRTCAEHVIELASILPEVDQLELIVEDSKQVAESKLQHLPPGVATLSDDEALRLQRAALRCTICEHGASTQGRNLLTRCWLCRVV